MSIDKKVFDIFFNENKHLLDYIPTEHPIDEENFIKWINNYTTPELKSLASLFRKYTRYISYSEYINKIAALCADIRSKSIDYNRIILLIPRQIDKSNFWVTLLHYNLINDIITDIVLDNFDNYQNKKLSDKCLGIICDDASYSGSQMYYNINGWYHVKMDILVSIPYMSSVAQKLLRKKRKNIIYSSETEIFYLFEDNLKSEFIDDKPALNIAKKYFRDLDVATLYFNHKLPDMISIFQTTYIFGYGLSQKKRKAKLFNYTPLSLIKNCDLLYARDFKLSTLDDNADIQNIVGVSNMCPIPFYKLFEYRYKNIIINDIQILIEEINIKPKIFNISQMKTKNLNKYLLCTTNFLFLLKNININTISLSTKNKFDKIYIHISSLVDYLKNIESNIYYYELINSKLQSINNIYKII